ncbi:hypothetical protein [Nostoc sp.]|uniref:hypothetical protein n=1 Tax=Nostoc sp. TaxID=1180 RepID=UPI002FFC7B96
MHFTIPIWQPPDLKQRIKLNRYPWFNHQRLTGKKIFSFTTAFLQPMRFEVAIA